MCLFWLNRAAEEALIEPKSRGPFNPGNGNVNRLIFISLLLASFVFGFFTPAASQEEKESFYSKSNRLILRLEHSEKVPGNSSGAKERGKPDGTAFLVQWKNELYIVTARHVVEKDHDLYAKVWVKNTRTGAIEMVFLNLPKDRWVFHPKRADPDTRCVDVAAMKITWFKGYEVMTFLYQADGEKESRDNQLPLKDPEPPQPVLVFGFPAEIGFELTEQRPLGRAGIVSMIAGTKFIKMEGKFVDEKACLVDIEAFPGNSGSPVINQFHPADNSTIKVLGLLIGTNPRRHYAMIEPVSRIRETLQAAKNQSLDGLSFWSIPDKKK